MGPSEEASSRSLSHGGSTQHTPKNSIGPKLQARSNFWCRAGVSASLEPCHSEGRAAPPQPLRDARRERSQRFSPGLQAARIIAARSKNEAVMGRDSPHGMAKSPTQGGAKPWF